MCYQETLSFSCGCQSMRTYACPPAKDRAPDWSPDLPVNTCREVIYEKLDIDEPCEGILPGGAELCEDKRTLHSRRSRSAPDLGRAPYFDHHGWLHKRSWRHGERDIGDEWDEWEKIKVQREKEREQRRKRTKRREREEREEEWWRTRPLRRGEKEEEVDEEKRPRRRKAVPRLIRVKPGTRRKGHEKRPPVLWVLFKEFVLWVWG